MGLIAIDSKVANQRFFQQNLKHCIPLLHPGILIIIFSVLAAFLLIFGAIYTAQAPSLLYLEQEHVNSETAINHTIQIPADKLQKDNIYIYYMLPKFYQNVRSYVQSFDLAQLSSDNFKTASLDKKCNKVSADAALNEPCGLIYETRVKDVYSISFMNGTSMQLKHDVAWPSDRKQNVLFGKAFKEMVPPEQPWNWEMLSVWMRPAPFPDVQKIYGYIPKETVASLIDEAKANSKDNVEIQLQTIGKHDFSPKRIVKLQQTSAIGGKKETLAIGAICLAVGLLCALSAMVFAMLMVFIGPRSKKYEMRVAQSQPIGVELRDVKSD